MFYSYSAHALLAASHILSVQAGVIQDRRFDAHNFRLEHHGVKAFDKATANRKTDNYFVLNRRSGISKSSKHLQQFQRARNPHKRDTGSTTPLISAGGGVEYLTQITFGTTAVDVIVDTGSSDTWLIQSNFKCVDSTGAAQAQSACNFGPAYGGSFGSNKIPNVNFNISYGDGEFVTGDFGTVDITLAGITVPSQTAALGNYAYWNGDGVSTGLLGLAYPGITSEFQGSDPTRDTNTKRNLYDPIFTTMYKDNLSSAMFSMAIQRGNGGYMAFGGLPPVNYTGSFAATPIQVTNLPGFSGSGSFMFYTITPDAVAYTGAPSSQSDAWIIDSGTTLVYAPSSVASAINNLFSPAATLSGGLYVVNCSAVIPSFGIKIGGQTFQVNSKDMVLQDSSSGQCISGIQDGGSGPYILGDVFMQSVVVVFDVGAGEMRFAAHLDY